jgi:hypothetical protein
LTLEKHREGAHISMAEEPTQRSLLSWISEGIILAGSPLAGYLIAFRYESGYSGFFKIPPEFININIISIFIATGAIYSLLFMILSLVAPILMVVPYSQTYIWEKVVR